MIFVCPSDGWLIIEEEWMPGEGLSCSGPWCKRKYEQEFGEAWPCTGS